MTYKKVTPISKGVLRIRSEPDENGRVCGSVSYGEEVTVETTKVTSKKGKEYYRLAGYGYILASQVRDAESQTEAEAKVDAAVKKAESAASKAEQAAKACDGIAAGMNVMIDSVTGKRPHKESRRNNGIRCRKHGIRRKCNERFRWQR